MSDDPGRFLRVYFDRLERDAPDVWYDPTCLSTFVRLLALSEKAWPSMPEIPVSCRRADLAKLRAADMIEYLPNHRYVLRGWVKEREKRAKVARENVSKRTDRATTVPTVVDTTVDTVVPPSVLPVRARPSSSSSVDVTEGVQGEPSPFPAIDTEAMTFLEGITGRHIRQAGDKQLAEYDRQIADHGLAKVIAAYHRVAKAIPHPTATQLVWSGRKILEPFVDAREVVDAERAAPRPRIVKPPVDEKARNEIIRQMQAGEMPA